VRTRAPRCDVQSVSGSPSPQGRALGGLALSAVLLSVSTAPRSTNELLRGLGRRGFSRAAAHRGRPCCHLSPLGVFPHCMFKHCIFKHGLFLYGLPRLSFSALAAAPGCGRRAVCPNAVRDCSVRRFSRFGIGEGVGRVVGHFWQPRRRSAWHVRALTLALVRIEPSDEECRGGRRRLGDAHRTEPRARAVGG